MLYMVYAIVALLELWKTLFDNFIFFFLIVIERMTIKKCLFITGKTLGEIFLILYYVVGPDTL